MDCTTNNESWVQNVDTVINSVWNVVQCVDQLVRLYKDVFAVRTEHN